MPQSSHPTDFLNQFLRGSYSAEPAVDEGDIAQRGLNILRRTRVGVEKFGDVDALHRGVKIGQARGWLVVGRASAALSARTSPHAALSGRTLKRKLRAAQTSANSSSSNCLLYRSV